MLAQREHRFSSELSDFYFWAVSVTRCVAHCTFCHSLSSSLSLPLILYPFIFVSPQPFPPSAATHSTVDGAEWHEAFGVVGQRAAVGFPVGVLAPLQDELLALEIMVLKTHPAGKKSGRGKNIRAKMVISTVWNQSEHKSDKWHQTGWEGLLVSLMSADASCRKLWVSYFGFFFCFFAHMQN